jgi:DNA-binding response OmpR family regulator
MPAFKILIVEDDLNLLEVLKYNLKHEGYIVKWATDGAKALELARVEKPNAILLDIMLPVMDGLDVCRILRKETQVPIIMLTARAGEIDKVVGLEIGADDYITKPFSLKELLARVKALLRRSSPSVLPQTVEESGKAVLLSNNIQIDLEARSARLGAAVLALNRREFDLLAFLLRHKGKVFTREQLLQRVWGYEYAGDTRTVDVHIRWLRQKIETDPGKPERIVTIRGTGYKFEG